MIFLRSRFGEDIIHGDSIYECDYEFVQIDGKVIKGSNDQRNWYPLKGRVLLGFDKSPKPSITISKTYTNDPFDFLEK